MTKLQEWHYYKAMEPMDDERTVEQVIEEYINNLNALEDEYGVYIKITTSPFREGFNIKVFKKPS